MIVSVNGKPTELPDEVEDHYAFYRDASDDQVLAILGRCVVLALNAGASEAEAALVAHSVSVQLANLRNPLRVN
jgi:hypothetical protein